MKWRIEQPDFKASTWKPAKLESGEKVLYCECQQLIDGRWEGYVSITRGKRDES